MLAAEAFFEARQAVVNFDDLAGEELRKPTAK